MSAGETLASTFDEARFAAWLAVERVHRHDVPGFEHAMFFEWTRLGRPAAAPEGAAAAPVVLAAPAPAPAVQRPAPRRQSVRRAAPAGAAPAPTSLF